MALIKVNKEEKTVAIKAKIPQSLETEIKQYMDWVGLKKIESFIEEAARYILKTDKVWKQQKISKQL